MAILASVQDPDGRTVVLTARRWGHIPHGYPEQFWWLGIGGLAVGLVGRGGRGDRDLRTVYYSLRHTVSMPRWP